MKVLLDYDPASQMLTEPVTGTFIQTWAGLERFAVSEEPKAPELQPILTDQLIQLREAGFSVTEIADMRKQGLL